MGNRAPEFQAGEYMFSNKILFTGRKLFSLKLMEKGLYKLYNNLAEKVEDFAVKSLFTYIASDSLKHTRILVTIIEERSGLKLREKDCDENIRYNLDLLNALSKGVSKRPMIDWEELISLVGTLAGFESLLYDEYSEAFRLGTRFINDWRDKSRESDLNIFSLIVDDEDQHKRILSSLVSLYDKKLDFKDNAPIVKYQKPDSWYLPPK